MHEGITEGNVTQDEAQEREQTGNTTNENRNEREDTHHWKHEVN